MTIPEEQLRTWANQGAIVLSKNTHESIHYAIDTYPNWLPNISKDIYLQGSYRGSTNIRGDSDVDLVIELTSVFWNNLSENEKQQLGLTNANYTLAEFKATVIDALTNYYGQNMVDTTGKKSIKVLANSGRLKADIVVCATYKYYENLKVRSQGITFWDNSSNQVINYPKIHIDNGFDKNSENNTNGWYKPTIRMYKNARNKLIENGLLFQGDCPSYFIECLLYNVPNIYFGRSYQDCFINTLNYLNLSLNQKIVNEFICQNGMYYLFGSFTVQWNTQSARNLVSSLLDLWKEW
ncbi:MAG: nucleotidyltransferase domain-containing protein [Anaerolineaceae bacterium]